MYGAGVNWAGEIVDLGSEAGVLEKSGTHYLWKGERIAHGREAACRTAENARLGLPPEGVVAA